MSKKQPHLSWFSPSWEEPNLKWRVDCEWKLCWSEQNTGMLAVVLLLQCLWVMISPPTAVTWGSGQFDTQTHVNEVKFGQFLIYNLPQRWKLSRSAHVDQTNLNVFLFLTAVCKDFLQFAKTIKMTNTFLPCGNMWHPALQPIVISSICLCIFCQQTSFNTRQV